MSMRYQKWLKLAHGVGVLAAVLTITGCSKDTEKISNSLSTSTETTSTAAAATNPDSQQLEFFTERYLAPEQRLQRRQDRVEAMLSAP